MKIVKAITNVIIRVFIGCCIGIVLIAIVIAFYIGWGLSPIGYIGSHTNFYPIFAYTIADYDFDPNSFREVDTLRVYQLSFLDRQRFAHFIHESTYWNLLPLTSKAKNAEQLIIRRETDEVMKEIEKIKNGYWFYDSFRQLDIYNSDNGYLYLFYSTKVPYPDLRK